MRVSSGTIRVVLSRGILGLCRFTNSATVFGMGLLRSTEVASGSVPSLTAHLSFPPHCALAEKPKLSKHAAIRSRMLQFIAFSSRLNRVLFWTVKETLIKFSVFAQRQSVK